MKITSAPNPQWKPGDKVASPVNEMVTLDPTTLDMLAKYRLLVDTIIPRPIAFVSTLSQNGTVNVAPYSFFNGVSTNPPAIMFSVAFKSDGTKKDTLCNIEQTGEFVVNTVGEWMVEAMNHCSAEYPYGVSEVEQVGLTALPSVAVSPPRIKESPVHLECRLLTLHQVGRQEAGAATVVIGEIVQFHIHKPAWGAGGVLAEELKPIARLGGRYYSALESAFELARPKPTVKAAS